MEPQKPCKPAGRPRQFCMETALDRALEVFWRKGYEGTTLPDLTEAMGINRPSLYAAYGNKESLFRRALDRYAERQKDKVEQALAAPTAREAAVRVLAFAADASRDLDQPRGCLMVHGALACGPDAEPVRQELIERRGCLERALRERFAAAVETGELPDEATAADLARFVSTVQQGMAVRAASGASADELRRIAATAIEAWPGRAEVHEKR